MKKRIIVTDMDDTLIQAHGNPTPETLQFWNSIGSDVVKIIATGQTYTKVKNVFFNFGMTLPNYIIADQGTVIYDTKKDNVMKRFLLPNKPVYTVYKEFLRLGGKCEFARVNGSEIVATDCEQAREFFTKTSQSVIYVENIEHVIKTGQYSKIILMHERNIVDELVRFSANNNDLFAINTGETLYGKCGFCRLEMMKVDKYTSLDFLLKKMEATPIDIICLGDELSDFGLAKCALKANLCKDSKGKFVLIQTGTEGNKNLQKKVEELAMELGFIENFSTAPATCESGWKKAVEQWI